MTSQVLDAVTSTLIKIECFQTCKTYDKDWDLLFLGFPHEGKHTDDNEQWLGSGYYFWPDSDIHAKWWGTVRLKQPFCITKYTVHIEYDLLFDMTGNTKHIEYFKRLVKSYQAAYEKSKNASMTTLPKPSVSSTIQYFRKYYRKAMFNYRAVKIYDDSVDRSYGLQMTTHSRERFNGLPRIQMCVFSDEKDCIKEKKPHSPPAYCVQVLAA